MKPEVVPLSVSSLRQPLEESSWPRQRRHSYACGDRERSRESRRGSQYAASRSAASTYRRRGDDTSTATRGGPAPGPAVMMQESSYEAEPSSSYVTSNSRNADGNPLDLKPKTALLLKTLPPTARKPGGKITAKKLISASQATRTARAASRCGIGFSSAD